MKSIYKNYHFLLNKIKNKTALVSVVGLGYVGMPLIKLIHEQGYKTIGIDLDLQKVKDLRKSNRKIFLSNSYKNLSNSDIIIFALPTPIKNFLPDLSYIENALKSLSPYLKKNSLLILESTNYPGSTREKVAKYLEKKKFVLGENIFLGYSPERIDPGNKVFNINNTVKICSGFSKKCLKLTSIFYSNICKKVIKASSLENAEMAKLFENIFRLVNIGLVNELKQICKKFNININEVLDLASSKPFGFMKFTPGPGVGGHCIPVDPFYFSWKAKQKKQTTKFVNLAAKINSKMPLLMFQDIKKILDKKFKKPKKCKLLFLGISYKRNIDDVRNSPSLEILRIFFNKGFNFDYNDNYVPNIKIGKKNFFSKKLKQLNFLKKYDCCILLTDHSYYRILDKKLKMIVIDTRNFFKKNINAIKI